MLYLSIDPYRMPSEPEKARRELQKVVAVGVTLVAVGVVGLLLWNAFYPQGQKKV